MVETPGRGPGGSRFESDRSHCEGTGCSGVSDALHAGSIPALATTSTALGRWRNSEAQLPCKEKVAGSNPARSTTRHVRADVAQRKRHGAQNAVSAGSNPAVSTHTRLDVAQRERAGFGSRRLGVRVSPSRRARPRMCAVRGWWKRNHTCL